MTDHRFYDVLGPLALIDLLDGLDVDSLPGSVSDVSISAASDLARSQPGQITFLASKKGKAALETARATACFVNEECASLVGAADIIPVISKTPRAHFGRILSRLATQKTMFDTGPEPEIDSSARVHATAVIGKGVKIGAKAQIEPYAVIGPGVEIGAGTVIGSHTSIKCAVIGQECQIKPSVCIGSRGFGVDADRDGVVDLPHIGRVLIGDRVSVGSQTAIDRGFLGDTVIADDVKVDNLVQIAHNVKIGDGTMIAGHAGISGSCTIGKNARLGGSAGLADHLTMGDGAILAARAGLMHNIPDGEMWSGIPAMPIRDHMRMISATRKLIAKKPK